MAAIVRGLSPEDTSRQLLKLAFSNICGDGKKNPFNFNDIIDTNHFQEFICYNKTTHIKIFL
jgi:hypothetical protein